MARKTCFKHARCADWTFLQLMLAAPAKHSPEYRVAIKPIRKGHTRPSGTPKSLLRRESHPHPRTPLNKEKGVSPMIHDYLIW